jgi:hypothetical protein
VCLGRIIPGSELGPINASAQSLARNAAPQTFRAQCRLFVPIQANFRVGDDLDGIPAPDTLFLPNGPTARFEPSRLTLELRRAVHRVASGSLSCGILACVNPGRFFRFQAGGMFWFSRKKFVGSYLFLIAVSRS